LNFFAGFRMKQTGRATVLDGNLQVAEASIQRQEAVFVVISG
jgi:hypothetical protein